MRNEVTNDWRWSDRYWPSVQQILQANTVHLFSFNVATPEQDMKQATDMIVTVSGQKAIAVRLRRDSYTYRDLTLRAARTSGATTELEKIRAGWGDFYLYGWTQGAVINEWMLVDLHKLRRCGLLNRPWSVIRNKDQATSFIAIPYMLLNSMNCVVNAQVKGRKAS